MYVGENKMIGLFFIGIAVSIIVLAILLYVRKYDV
jgi:LPXTG-motif cell wall-anchored protein